VVQAKPAHAEGLLDVCTVWVSEPVQFLGLILSNMTVDCTYPTVLNVHHGIYLKASPLPPNGFWTGVGTGQGRLIVSNTETQTVTDPVTHWQNTVKDICYDPAGPPFGLRALYHAEASVQAWWNGKVDVETIHSPTDNELPCANGGWKFDWNPQIGPPPPAAGVKAAA
jgi:hypothetical protein